MQQLVGCWCEGNGRGAARNGIEPVVEASGLAEQVYLRLLKIEAGVEDVDVAGALLQAGVLLVFGCELGLAGGGAIGCELGEDGVKLGLCELLVEVGDFGVGATKDCCRRGRCRGSRGGGYRLHNRTW